ncbi:MAG: proline--tRNA ligase [Acidimicrobiales bacterium]
MHASADRASNQPQRKGGLTPRADDFPRWYQEVVAEAGLADNGPVRGTMVIRPWGYGIWELLQRALDDRIKAAGAENAYFPLFIPESFLQLEAEHVEGFAPELAVVTHAGGKQLEEPVVVRPTSETVINSFFAKWIQGYRDLPLLINQWANVVRWELRPRILLRTTEFLWQEGHTAHATEDEARAYALRIFQDVYVDTMEQICAVPVVTGHKTARERFAGAIRTWSCEGMMGDGKALQMGTSHELGQNFARAFSIEFANDKGTLDYVWQTSWGVSTRLLGALVMAHGDDFGLRLPPALAPTEVVVLAVRDEPDVRTAADALMAELAAAGRRVRLDDRFHLGFGRRSVDWERKGVPLRVEVGPRDLAGGQVTMVVRHLRTKAPVPLAGVVAEVDRVLSTVAGDLADEARAFRAARTSDVATVEEAVEVGRSGFARLPFPALGPDGEDRLAGESLSVRCLQRADGSVARTDTDEADLVAVIGRSY